MTQRRGGHGTAFYHTGLFSLRNLQSRQAEREGAFQPTVPWGEFQADDVNERFRPAADIVILPLDEVLGYGECLIYSESEDSDGKCTARYSASWAKMDMTQFPSVWVRWKSNVKRKIFERAKTAQGRYLEAMGPVLSCLRGRTGKPQGHRSVTILGLHRKNESPC